MNQNGEEEDAEYEVEDWGQLPSVDDMEVAALAAEAAMEAVSLRAEGRRPPQASSSDVGFPSAYLPGTLVRDGHSCACPGVGEGEV